METPIFREEEGRYLASSVGDPLIKGLAKIAQSRPKDPLTYLATYLYNFARTKSGASIQKSEILIVPDRPEEQVDMNSSSSLTEDPNNTSDEDYMRSPVSDVPESAFSPANRDEHGQSMLHFAGVRTRPKDGLFHILQETQINVGYRDELYRTARDVAEESNFQENVADIDRFVVYLSARGETEKLVELLLEGYDHILDAEDGGVNIVDITAERNREATIQFLQGIPTYIVRNFPHQWYALINKFCQALWKPEYGVYHPVRAKELYPLDKDLPSNLQLQPCTLKNGKRTFAHYPDESLCPRRERNDNEPLFIIPNTVMFLKNTSAPWSRFISKSTGYHYYFNRKTNARLYDAQRPETACASFSETFVTRMEWPWLYDKSLSIDYLYENVKKKCPDIKI